MFQDLKCSGTCSYQELCGLTAICHILREAKNPHFCSDFCYPTGATTKSLKLTDVVDYREELLLPLSTVRALATQSILKAQKHQKIEYVINILSQVNLDYVNGS